MRLLRSQFAIECPVQAGLLLFERLYGGLLSWTEGSQGTSALKWTKTIGIAVESGHGLQPMRAQPHVSYRFLPELTEWFLPNKLSWEYLAGLFDAIALVRICRGQLSLEIPHKCHILLENIKAFLEDRLDARTGEKRINLRGFHRCRLIIRCNVLSYKILEKLVCFLRVRRPAVELILHPRSEISLYDLRLLASAQGAFLGLHPSIKGEFRVIPRTKSFKRILEFQARQEETHHIRDHLEVAKHCLSSSKHRHG